MELHPYLKAWLDTIEHDHDFGVLAVDVHYDEDTGCLVIGNIWFEGELLRQVLRYSEVIRKMFYEQVFEASYAFSPTSRASVGIKVEDGFTFQQIS